MLDHPQLKCSTSTDSTRLCPPRSTIQIQQQIKFMKDLMKNPAAPRKMWILMQKPWPHSIQVNRLSSTTLCAESGCQPQWCGNSSMTPTWRAQVKARNIDALGAISRNEMSKPPTRRDMNIQLKDPLVHYPEAPSHVTECLSPNNHHLLPQ